MAQYAVGQEIPFSIMNAYPITLNGREVALAVRESNGYLWKIKLSRQADDPEMTIRARGVFDPTTVQLPVENLGDWLEIPGTSLDVTTEGDVQTGWMKYRSRPAPEPVG